MSNDLKQIRRLIAMNEGWKHFIIDLDKNSEYLRKMEMADAGKVIENIQGIKVEVEERIRTNEKIKQLILERIGALGDPYKAVLLYRYRDGLKWDQIADYMRYDVRWVYRMHKKALTMYEQPAS